MRPMMIVAERLLSAMKGFAVHAMSAIIVTMELTELAGRAERDIPPWNLEIVPAQVKNILHLYFQNRSMFVFFIVIEQNALTFVVIQQIYQRRS